MLKENISFACNFHVTFQLNYALLQHVLVELSEVLIESNGTIGHIKVD